MKKKSNKYKHKRRIDEQQSTSDITGEPDDYIPTDNDEDEEDCFPSITESDNGDENEGDNKEKKTKKNKEAEDPRLKWTLIEDEGKYDNHLKLDDEHWPLHRFVQEDYGEYNPYELFQLFFTNDLFQHFYESTKYHAEKKNHKTKSKRYEVLVQKKSYCKLPIKKNEIKVYLGILLFMSLNKLGNYTGIYFYL